MSAMSPVSKDSPLWLAWQRYRESEAYTTAQKYQATNFEGNQWGAFMAGFFEIDRLTRERNARPTLEEIQAALPGVSEEGELNSGYDRGYDQAVGDIWDDIRSLYRRKAEQP